MLGKTMGGRKMTCAERIWALLSQPHRPCELVAALDEYSEVWIYKALRRLKLAGAVQKRGAVYVRVGPYAADRPVAPSGFVSAATLSRRLHIVPGAIRERLRNGWPVSWVRLDGHVYIEDRQSYPPMEPRTGPLMRELLNELERPKALRALAAGRSYASVNGALHKLRRRGLVEQVSFGVWARA